jgi:molybdopterin molybdotransferase
MGAFDYIKNAVETSVNLNFWKVAMRPGKPLAFGSYRDIPFFGLPGNPVSSYMSSSYLFCQRWNYWQALI